MNLANRISELMPIKGVTIEIEEDGEGYNIFFRFPALGFDAVRHTKTLNLSNVAIYGIVREVAVGFRDMIRELNVEPTMQGMIGAADTGEPIKIYEAGEE